MMFDGLYTTKMKGNSKVLKERFKRIYFGPKQFSRKVGTRITVLLLLMLTGVTVSYAYIDGAENENPIFESETDRCRKWLQSLDAEKVEIIRCTVGDEERIGEQEKEELVSMFNKVTIWDIRKLGKDHALGDGTYHEWYIVKMENQEYRIDFIFGPGDFGMHFEGVEIVFDSEEAKNYIKENLWKSSAN